MVSSITIKVIKGHFFFRFGHRYTPRLSVTVDYTKGGKSQINGKRFERGYYLNVRHDHVDDEGLVHRVIDGNTDPSQCILPAKKFSSAVLLRLAAEVRAGNHNELVNRLYAEAAKLWPHHNWQSAIQIDKELDEAVKSVVNKNVKDQ